MKVVIAKEVGFCHGVNDAIEKILSSLKKGISVYTLGPIIHNPQMVQKLSIMGAKIVDIETLPSEGELFIRSHGVPESVMDNLRECKAKVVDTTCENVKRVKRIVKEEKNKGIPIIFVGKRGHPETQSIKEIADSLYIIEEAEDIESLPFLKEATLLCQTTASLFLFEEIKKKLMDKIQSLYVFDTLCEASKRRQKEALMIAKEVDAVLVIGGRNSANTSTLYTICKKINPSTYHIETKEELKEEYLQKIKSIGVLTGTSTPSWILHEVLEEIKKLKYNEEER